MKGQCLCGAIAFEVTEIPGVVYNCHCSRCRISHGADYATMAFAQRSSLVFLRGQELLSEYESTGGMRTFCSLCGSRLMNYAKSGAKKHGDYMSVAIACLDSDYQGKAVAHCFTASKAPWHEPTADIANFDGFPDQILP